MNTNPEPNGKTELIPGVGSSELLGVVLLIFLFVLFAQQFQNLRLGEHWAIQADIHLAEMFCLKRNLRRFVRFLRRVHTNLLIRWLRGQILALKILNALFEFRNRLLNCFVAHKYVCGPMWPWTPNIMIRLPISRL